MSAPQYRVVFAGQLLPGRTVEEVAAELAARFKLPADKVARLFDGRAHVIRAGLSFEQAMQLKAVFTESGAACRLDAVEAPAAAPAAAEPAAKPAWSCPKCGLEQQPVAECPRCGIIVERYLAARERPAPQPERVTLGNVVRERSVDWIIDWVRGHLVIAGVALALLLFFGGELVMSSLFFSRDRHVIYQVLGPLRECFNTRPFRGVSTDPVTMRQQEMNYEFTSDYKTTDRSFNPYDLVGDELCRHGYAINLGNVGEEVLEEVSLRFASEDLAALFPDGAPTRHLRFDYSNLSAATPRDRDPQGALGPDGVFRVRDFAPGTLVTIRFAAWLGPEREVTAWETVLRGVEAPDAAIDEGDPRATSLGRVVGGLF